MAFYFALFNVSSVNLEENAKKNKYKELKKSRQRCRSADGRVKARTQLSSDVKPLRVRKITKDLHLDVGGSLESLPSKNKSNDYHSQLSRPQVVEVYNGRKISAPAVTQLPRSRLTSATDSVGTATSLVNGDIRKEEDSPFERVVVNLARRGSTPSYKKVTFRYSHDATNTVTLREEPSPGKELEYPSKYPLHKEQPANQVSTNAKQNLSIVTQNSSIVAQNSLLAAQNSSMAAQNSSSISPNTSSSFSSRFLGKLSCTSPKIKRNATWHFASNNRRQHQQQQSTTLILPKTSTSPLNKLRAIIKKLIVENRQKKIINSLKQAAVLYQQQEQMENERKAALNQIKKSQDNQCLKQLPNDNLALETLQNLQNQTMEEKLRNQSRSNVGTGNAAVHRHSLFGQSWSRREEQQAIKVANDEHQWSTTLSLRRTPSVTNCSNSNRNSVEIKLKRRSAAIMETNPVQNSTENESKSNQNQTLRTMEKNSRKLPKSNQRAQSKEKDQLQRQQQENNKQVVRRRSTTDKSRSPSAFKSLARAAHLGQNGSREKNRSIKLAQSNLHLADGEGSSFVAKSEKIGICESRAWTILKSKKRSSSSTSQQSNEMGDEEMHKLLPIYDENRNPYVYSSDKSKSNNINEDRQQVYGWLPINGYVNPLFVSLSAPNSPAHVRMREKVRKTNKKCQINKRTEQRISLVETDLMSYNHRQGVFPKPKTSWWNRSTERN